MGELSGEDPQSFTSHMSGGYDPHFLSHKCTALANEQIKRNRKNSRPQHHQIKGVN